MTDRGGKSDILVLGPKETNRETTVRTESERKLAVGANGQLTEMQFVFVVIR
jgi:hypothetical protein